MAFHLSTFSGDGLVFYLPSGFQCIIVFGQDKGERSGEERYPGPPGWRLRRWTSTPTLAKMFLG
jgi:hypothetical protein